MKVELVDCSKVKPTKSYGQADHAYNRVFKNTEVYTSAQAAHWEHANQWIEHIVNHLKEDGVMKGGFSIPKHLAVEDGAEAPAVIRKLFDKLNCDRYKLVVFAGDEEDVQDNAITIGVIEADFDTQQAIRESKLDLSLDAGNTPAPALRR